MTGLPVRVAGTGICLPSQVLTSDELGQALELDEEWILRRTGIRERRIAADHEAVSDLAIRAGDDALRAAGIYRSQVALVVLATSTPDHPLPPTAPAVAHRLGLAVGAFDLAAACSGFVYGFALAARWLAAAPDDERDSALVIGANILSRRVNWRDPRTAPIFGDGAGAVVIQRRRGPAPTANQLAGGVLAVDLAAHGEHWCDIQIPAGGSRKPVTHDGLDAGETLMVMENGSAMFRRAVRAMTASAERTLERAGVSAGDLSWLIPHQAGARIVSEVAEALGVSDDRVIRNFERYGNTSAASIPIALHEALTDHRIRSGDLVLLTAVGSGMTAGSLLLRWD